MARRKHSKFAGRIFRRKGREIKLRQNKVIFRLLMEWMIADGELFTKDQFHGNINWSPEQLAQQAVIWALQENRNVTDAFAMTVEACLELGMDRGAQTYTAFMNALHRYRATLSRRLQQQFHRLAEDVAGPFWRDGDWVLIGFDGSRVTTPRTVSNETEFCAPNFGQGKTAKYRKKKTQGMRRRKNERNKAQPQVPQVWITIMWHMTLRLPWTWRLGPSNSSERGHVMEMLEQEEFPEHTLFCGDAGFVGFPLWNAILDADGDFLVRVGANVKLLTEHADVKHLDDGIVLCWPKDKMNSGVPPLRLRLVRVRIGKTKMWMLTNVLNERVLPKSKIVAIYKKRWGVEVAFRGLKQRLDKAHLRCRNCDRVYVELDWSLRAMAIVELMALREQIPHRAARDSEADYHTQDRSLANTVRALRQCLRNLTKLADPSDDLLQQLANAVVQDYNNRTDKKSRYRPKNPDKKPLGDPTVTKLTREQREKLRKINERIAA